MGSFCQNGACCSLFVPSISQATALHCTAPVVLGRTGRIGIGISPPFAAHSRPALYQQDTARAGKTWIGKYHNRYSPVTPIEEFEYFGFVLQIKQSNGNVEPISNKRLFYRMQLRCRRPGVRLCPAAGPRACGQSRLRAIRCPAGIMKNSWGRGQDWGATDWTEQESTARVSVEGRSILIVRSADNR